MFASKLKQRLNEGKLSVGVLLSFDFWPGHIELFKSAGIDYAIVDLEHGSCDLRTAEELFRTARLLDFPLLVRPEASVHHIVKKYMDTGAAGLMVPWMETESQLAAMRDAVFTPPRGRRGPGGASVFANRTLDRAGWDEMEQSFFLMFQVESQAGLANVREFAKADWVDAVMMGPYDLSLNLSRWADTKHPDVVAAIRQVRIDTEAAGKPCGMVMADPETARFWIEDGFRMILLPDPAILAKLHLQWFLKEIGR